MLVLRRTLLESIIIGLPDGREVELQITELKRHSVKLGFTAPEDVTVHRKEIADAIKREGRARAKAE
jgi:carbon storage regulator